MLEPLPSSKDPGVESKVYESQVDDEDEDEDEDDDDEDEELEDEDEVHDQLAAHPDRVVLPSVVNRTRM